MLDLSPTKLLIIFVVAVLLLGPKRLPTFARQLGAGWRRLKEMHSRLDTEVRQSIPDLPSGRQLARFARSPMTLLDRLAELPDDGQAATAQRRPDDMAGPGIEPSEATGPGEERRPGAAAPAPPDDPSLN